MAIFSIIDGLIFILFNRENFEQAPLNIQIWVGLRMHNIMIRKCYILGLVALKTNFKIVLSNVVLIVMRPPKTQS